MGDDLINRSNTYLDVFTGVVRYVTAHPGAKDTPDGIRRWWKQPPAREWAAAELDAVLEDLTGRDWLVVRETGQLKLYGANPSHLAEMARFLAEYASTKE